MMNEIDVCYELFNWFQHPMLKNLGRRFQKYMNKWQEWLADGGPGNLKQRTTMSEKLDWMMSTAVSSKIPELFGASTDMWLAEWYPTEISTMPYAAMLFWHREEQMLGPTREHVREQFQSGYHIPMFVFMQNKNFWDVFRDTGIAFAYTISESCGKELQRLTSEAGHNRLSGRNKNWSKDFQKFWKNHGKELMHKLSGMRDPMLNLMINDPVLFDDLLEHQPAEKQKEYRILREKKSVVKAYHQRLLDTYGDSTQHAAMDRNKWFYSGDHFRFRDGFESGIPIAWVNWDNYIDANFPKDYGRGEDATGGDGVFNEIRGFLYAIPEMAEKMAEKMWFKGDKKYIDKIAQSLFERNTGEKQLGRLLKQKIDATNPKAEYCSMTAMMLEIIPLQKLTKTGIWAKDQERFSKYYEQMGQCLKKAKEIEDREWFSAALNYRIKMAGMWSKIVKSEIFTEKLSLDDIYNGNHDSDALDDLKKKTQARSGTVLTDKLQKFETDARKDELNNPQSKDTQPDDSLGLAA